MGTVPEIPNHKDYTDDSAAAVFVSVATFTFLLLPKGQSLLNLLEHGHLTVFRSLRLGDQQVIRDIQPLMKIVDHRL